MARQTAHEHGVAGYSSFASFASSSSVCDSRNRTSSAVSGDSPGAVGVLAGIDAAGFLGRCRSRVMYSFIRMSAALFRYFSSFDRSSTRSAHSPSANASSATSRRAVR